MKFCAWNKSRDKYRTAFRTKLGQGHQLRFYIPKEIAHFKNINAGALFEFRLLKESNKKFKEIAILRTKVCTEKNSLVAYVSKKIEAENNLVAGMEIDVEVIGRVL